MVRTPRFPCCGAWVPFPVKELRPHRPCSAAKKKKKEKMGGCSGGGGTDGGMPLLADSEDFALSDSEWAGTLVHSRGRDRCRV